MSKLEGNIKMNELGQILISVFVISAGSIIKIKFQDEWNYYSIEESQGNYYSVPYINFEQDMIASLDE